MGILSGISYWLLVWFLVSIPVSLMLAQLLKAASERLLCEETERRLEIRQSGCHPSRPEEVACLPRGRMLPLGAGPAISPDPVGSQAGSLSAA